MKDVSIVVITGMSGSGKSIAIRALEDVGYFCIDNMPIALLPKLLELSDTASSEFTRFALVMDCRGPHFVKEFDKARRAAIETGYPLHTVFLDASDEMLLRRYSETRRKHPLDVDGDLLNAVRREREDMANLREVADEVIDTSNLSVHELRREIQDRFSATADKFPLRLTIKSFGYKFGVPTDANLVFDVRFLPNPFFIPHLKSHTGAEPEVAAYVLDHDVTKRFLEYLRDLLQFLLPYYEKEGKHYLTVAIGCTGGVHRSVAIVEHLAATFRTGRHQINVVHRDLKRYRPSEAAP